ncbi:hypothetical protein CDAR_120521 [Caerostris darwini]|uniref:Uncharacterized protein n=1 Tax=Caerostris darwini TaxID=1538125 RepID=A0AAV4W737_9ARAC|nr:hypothetical protein CDAR_120521 [Caerostris darwini]
MTPQLTWATIQVFLLRAASTSTSTLISPIWNTLFFMGSSRKGLILRRSTDGKRGHLAGEVAIYFFFLGFLWAVQSPAILDIVFQVYVPLWTYAKETKAKKQRNECIF